MSAAKRPPGRPRTMSAEDRRALILRHATAAFAHDGLGGATIDSISESSGVAKPGIYELFPSKAELYEAAVENELGHFADGVTEAWRQSPDHSLEARTRARVAAVFSHARDNPDGLRLLVLASNQPSPEMLGRFEDVRSRLTERLAEMISAELSELGIEGGTVAELLAAIAIESTVAVALRSLGGRDPDVAAAEELVASFIAAGFAGLDRDALRRLGDTPPG